MLLPKDQRKKPPDMNKTPRLTVLGAGPGNAELITLKALRVIQTADVLMYDALVSDELLEFVPAHCIRLFVGKRKARHTYPQQEINRMIVSYAHRCGHVIRLKGGDPFVFGRGAEELEYAAAHGLHTAYVPGLSSAVAVPGTCGIPVTLRGVSESFWVITATTGNAALSADLTLAARSTATVVVLMGLGKAAEISSVYRQAGAGDTPAAVISHGTLQQQNVSTGVVGNLATLAETHDSPAVIVIGEVVKHKLSLATEQTLLHELTRFAS
jgi:uroporphyrin-III C-methyltransferase